ncbi:MAG: preprotein translocase subunit SecE [Chloroflexi bacterium]|nr:preprotein translocase subunit SecE [Chloroflexota bacterium]MDA1220116.1 preprotein translocase subunit SecE [Chloroflexota bacterium]
MARASTRRPQSPGAMGRVNPVTFMQEVISELRKSVWPSREEIARLTAVVIALAAAVGVFLGGLDRAFAEIFARLIF